MKKSEKERYINNAISKYPEFIEEGLKNTRQEHPIGRKRIDILFDDKNNNALIVELKVEGIQKRHIDQLLGYKEDYLKRGRQKNSNHEQTVRTLLICNRELSVRLSETLKNSNIEWKKLNEHELDKFINNADCEKHDKEYTFQDSKEKYIPIVDQKDPKKRRSFWIELLAYSDYLLRNDKCYFFCIGYTPKKNYFYVENFAAGKEERFSRACTSISDVSYAHAIAGEKIWVELSIDHKNRNEREEIHNYLRSHAQEIEKKISSSISGGTFCWDLECPDDNPEKKRDVKRIKLYSPYKYSDSNQLNKKLIQDVSKRMHLFMQSLNPHLESYKKLKDS